MRRLLVLPGCLLALLAFAAGATLGAQSDGALGAGPGTQVIRLTLPRGSHLLRDLRARIRVEGATSTVRPYRVTRRSAWLRIPGRDLPASAAESELRVRITLLSGSRVVLDRVLNIRDGRGDSTAESPSAIQPSGIDTGPTSEGPPSAFAPEATRSGSDPTGGTGADSGPLRWAPPALVDPRTITVAGGHDPDVLRLSTKQDYILKLPAGGIHGTVEINGGHNVVLIGGEVTVPSTANQTDNGADDTDTAIYVRAATGTVHIEGVLIRADPDTMFDGIDVNAPLATVQVENVRVEDVYGSKTTEHADVIQTWGGAKALRVDGLTANGDYQGLMIAPALGSVGSVQLQNVDLTAEAPPPALAASTHGGGIMLWLTAGTGTCQSSPVTLEDVFIANQTGRLSSPDTVWPSPLSKLACDPVIDQTAGASPTISRSLAAVQESVSWPGLPVAGSVTIGSPPGGEFVPAGVAGDGYVTPGYVGG